MRAQPRRAVLPVAAPRARRCSRAAGDASSTSRRCNRCARSPTAAPYGASKGGVVQLTRAQAEAWSRHGRQLQRDRARVLRDAADGAGLRRPGAVAGERRRARSSAATASSTDLAGTAIFLASRASDYVTGQTLFVDGGFSADDGRRTHESARLHRPRTRSRYRDEPEPVARRRRGAAARSTRSASAARTCTPITATIRAASRR